MSGFTVDEQALFGCALCSDGVVVFESQHIFPDLQNSGDLFGCDSTSRTEPKLVGGGVIFLPHPTPDWKMGYSTHALRDGRGRQSAIMNSAICEQCLEDKTVQKLLAYKKLSITTKLTRY